MTNRPITILINTSQTKEIAVGLRLATGDVWRQEPITPDKAQRVLPLIHNLLAEQKYTWQDITAIEVNRGPGSFTGLRVGFAVANALGSLLGVPVNGKAGQTALPRYKDNE